MPKIKWDDVEELDFTPIPEGKYVVEIDDVKIDKTKAGDEMWKVRFNVIGPVGEKPKFAGRKLFTNLVDNEGGHGNFKKIYSAIFGTKLPKTQERGDILNEKLVVDVTIGEYNGKPNNQIPYAGFHKLEEDDEEFN